MDHFVLEKCPYEANKPIPPEGLPDVIDRTNYQQNLKIQVLIDKKQQLQGLFIQFHQKTSQKFFHLKETP